jgi:F-box protein 6
MSSLPNDCLEINEAISSSALSSSSGKDINNNKSTKDDDSTEISKHISIEVSSPLDPTAQRPSNIIDELPENVLDNILFHLSGRDLIQNASLVCKRWQQLIDTEAFWLNKCIHDNILTRQHAHLLHTHQIFESKRIFFSNLLNRNLLKNPCGQQGFTHWCSSNGRFHNPEIEKILDAYKRDVGVINEKYWKAVEFECTDPLFDDTNRPNSYFVTSYTWTTKMQVIELDNYVLQLFVANGVSLKVTVGECYVARRDCACRYQLRVFLIDASLRIVDSFEFFDAFPQWSDAKWRSVRHVFRIEQPNIRYVLFANSGSDSQYWAGYYGSRMTNGFVSISV